MIDIHTHILPGIDDGCKTVEETLEIMNYLVNSGIKKVVATPHFYSEVNNIENFLTGRQEAYEKIRDKIPDGLEVVLGAEVLLDFGLHKKDIRKLVIANTDYILLEMPYSRWEPWVFEEIFKISATHGLEIIIAHVDRYVKLISSESMETLLSMGLKYQVNIDDMGGFFRKSEAMTLMRNGVVHFIGSDCHNTDFRPPCLLEGIKKIRTRLGDEYADYYMSNAEKMLRNESIN